MHCDNDKVSPILLMTTYAYLTLPILLFFLFWLKSSIGIPAAFLLLLGMILCLKNHDLNLGNPVFSKNALVKLCAIFCIVVIWVVLSGVGGYVWQNSDHHVRNEIFNVMVQDAWPLRSNTSESIPLVYYIGYWLPAAAIGKLCGPEIGYLFLFLWTAFGILLCYALICLKRQKISVWPLLVFLFFSGLDCVGTILVQAEPFQIFGIEHLEAWSLHFQYSSMTTQLFWVFNQSVPAWLACTLVFYFERPQNMLFTLSLLLLVSSFPFIGLIPFAVYFMIKRSFWHDTYPHVHCLIRDIWKNWASVQNLLAAPAICGICGLYLSGNEALSGTVGILYTEEGRFRIELILIAFIGIGGGFCVCAQLALHGFGKYLKAMGLSAAALFLFSRLCTFDYPEWWALPFIWVNLTLFYFLEAGIFLLILSPMVSDRPLLRLNALCLYLIPLIRIGYSCDFCMRASIPGLFLVLLWCIEALSQGKAFLCPDKLYLEKNVSVQPPMAKRRAIALLAILLLVGSITPLHEWKRTYVNTFHYYEPYSVSEEELFQGPNVRGNPESVFWQYLSR
jgi:hypothetical protein